MKTTDIEKTTLDIEEAGVKLRLTIVDTPGYGDGLKGADSWQTCVKSVTIISESSILVLRMVLTCFFAGMWTISLRSTLKGRVA